jgi:hypothetical protein
MAHHHQRHDHGHTHGAIDPSIATTERGIWAVKWSFAGLCLTALLQAVAVWLTGSVALLADPHPRARTPGHERAGERRVSRMGADRVGRTEGDAEHCRRRRGHRLGGDASRRWTERRPVSGWSADSVVAEDVTAQAHPRHLECLT